MLVLKELTDFGCVQSETTTAASLWCDKKKQKHVSDPVRIWTIFGVQLAFDCRRKPNMGP